MWKRQWITAIVVLITTSLLACESEPKRGNAGESCTAANDCGDGLACIGLVCVPTGAKADAGLTDSASSCGARRDCPEGTVCITNSCQPMSVGESPGARYSGRGESCQATTDCETTLSCVMGICRESGITLTHLPKSCHRVECATKQDCCDAFVPNDKCETYRANCAMDPIFCNTYRSLCECSQDCVDELCLAAQPGCMTDRECTSAQTPFCMEGKCRQCNKDSACPGTSAKCAAGVCMSPCKDDANCPLLYTCRDNACMQTGCSSDRECAFITKNSLAVCKDKKCQSPCAADADCAGSAAAMSPGAGSAAAVSSGFEICEQGECKFVGCETDVECRALLNIAGERGKVRAVCR